MIYREKIIQRSKTNNTGTFFQKIMLNAVKRLHGTVEIVPVNVCESNKCY